MSRDVISNLPAPTPETIKAVRLLANLTQAQAAVAAGMSSKVRWSEYERGVTTIEPARWALFLLVTDQHPTLKLTKRRAPPSL